MNHRNSLRKLGRSPSHREALFRNMATALVLNGRIETTLAKAKELRRVGDAMITLGKKNTLHARRQALSYLRSINQNHDGNSEKTTAVHKLFTEWAPGFSGRHGGYTRVLKTGFRKGDNAPMAIVEYVTGEVKVKEVRRRRVVRPLEEMTPETESPSTADAEN